MKSPAPSPVKGRPVRLAPWAPGGEAEDEDPGAGVAEAGDWPCPVGVVLIGAAAGFADAGAVGAQAGTKLAGDDGIADLVQFKGRGRKLAKRLKRRYSWGRRRAGRFWTDRFHRFRREGRGANPYDHHIDRIHASE